MAPAAVIAAMQKLQSQEISCPSSVSQAAALAALAGPQECLKEMRQEYMHLRDLAVSELAAVPGFRTVFPGGGLFVFPEISAHLRDQGMKTSREFAAALLRQTGVLTVPGDGFGLADHLRISFSVAESELSKGIRKLRTFLEAVTAPPKFLE